MIDDDGWWMVNGDVWLLVYDDVMWCNLDVDYDDSDLWRIMMGIDGDGLLCLMMY